MGLYDRDYMRERGKAKSSPQNSFNSKLIMVAVIAFILGIIVCKIIL
ncbi:hypothetical protein HG1285_19091 [Hydrogenivirga sp. 128-5-R1-1]|nr:hypothetical protein HG1285_19091 [Hydrogenivirga sp. 128-5-R1-1]